MPPDGGCELGFVTCATADVVLASSATAGRTWRQPRRLDPRPMRLDWMADGEIGAFLGDYVSLSWIGGRPVPVFALARPPVGGELRQAMYAGVRVGRLPRANGQSALIPRLTAPWPSTRRPKSVAVIGAALDLGSGRRGVDMGPSAIRYAGLDARLKQLGLEVVDRGNVGTAVAEAVAEGDERLRYLEPILRTCAHIADLVAQASEQGHMPLVLGGDHSVALGTLGGLARVRGPGGVLWLDAHGDLNRPETTPSGNVHGMALAAALGLAGPAFAARRVAAAGGPAEPAWRWSACARSTRASVSCSATWSRRSSRWSSSTGWVSST